MNTQSVTFAPLDLEAHALAALSVQRRANAMSVEEAAGRRVLFDRHACNPGLRSFGAWDDRRLVGFGYGNPLDPDWWWAIVVARQLKSRGGGQILEDAFALLELHVLPTHQRRGIGRELLRLITDGAEHPQAVLTTPVSALPAQHLYRSVGFSTLLPSVALSSKRSFTVMGALLPLLTATGTTTVTDAA